MSFFVPKERRNLRNLGAFASLAGGARDLGKVVACMATAGEPYSLVYQCGRLFFEKMLDCKLFFGQLFLIPKCLAGFMVLSWWFSRGFLDCSIESMVYVRLGEVDTVLGQIIEGCAKTNVREAPLQSS